MSLPRLCVHKPVATTMGAFIVVLIGLFALTIGLDRYADPRLKDAR